MFGSVKSRKKMKGSVEQVIDWKGMEEMEKTRKGKVEKG